MDITYKTLACFLFFSFVGVSISCAQKVFPVRTVEKWKVIELKLNGHKVYHDPLTEVSVDAIFTGPNGERIRRPAFWDGGAIFKVRFAPTAVGKWSMLTICSDADNRDLDSLKATVNCVPYQGNLAIYKHGFLKVSTNHRYFTFNDGTPFFYLGDTHWLYIHERYFTSNHKGIPSEFRYIVDKRVEQGFSVYQSEAIQHPHLQHATTPKNSHQRKDEEMICNFRDGLDEKDLPGLANIDRKFKYVAEKGLVNANSAICWALDPIEYPNNYSEKYMYLMARYWDARYGAYPVLWTVAQEIDKNMYQRYDSVSIKKWFAVGQAIADNDDYHQPLTAHMESTERTTAADSWWDKLPFHSWWAIQWQSGSGNDIARVGKKFYEHQPAKPGILYESAYEEFWTGSDGALAAGYEAFQNGMMGYGYGANGVWNDLYSNRPADYGTDYEMPARYLNWYEGANLPAAKQLTFFRKFYEEFAWWKLVPRFDNTQWSSFADRTMSFLSTIDNNLYIVLFVNNVRTTGCLKNLETGSEYRMQWFDIHSGKHIPVGTIRIKDGRYEIPLKPTDGYWVFTATKI